jgi:hypothetical protein
VTEIGSFILPLPIFAQAAIAFTASGNNGVYFHHWILVSSSIGFVLDWFANFESSVCTLSSLRLHTLKVAVETTYPTWDDVAVDGAATWHILELIMRNVCSCLPTLRPLVTRIVPRIQSSELLIRQLALSDLRFFRELELMIAERNACLRIAEERAR